MGVIRHERTLQARTRGACATPYLIKVSGPGLEETPKVKPVSLGFFGGKLDYVTRFLFDMKPLKKRQAEAPSVRPA